MEGLIRCFVQSHGGVAVSTVPTGHDTNLQICSCYEVLQIGKFPLLYSISLLWTLKLLSVSIVN